MNQPKVKYSLSNWDLVTVNPNYKTWDWKDLFCFWGNNIQSIIAFSLITSLYLVYDLSFVVVFFLSKFTKLKPLVNFNDKFDFNTKDASIKIAKPSWIKQ